MDGVTVAAVMCAAMAAALVSGPPLGVVRVRGLVRSAPPGVARLRPSIRAPADQGRLPVRNRAFAAALAGSGAWALLGGVPGVAAGAVAAAAAWRTLGRLEPRRVVNERHQVAAALPLAADLLAAAVAAGAPPEPAAEAVGRAVGGPLGARMVAATAASRVGAEPAAAWSALLADPGTRPLARAVVSAADRGSGPVPMLERVAHDARDTARWAAESQARSLGARAAAPLGLCFLPAFVLVGIVPLIATVAMPLLG